MSFSHCRHSTAGTGMAALFRAAHRQQLSSPSANSTRIATLLQRIYGPQQNRILSPFLFRSLSNSSSSNSQNQQHVEKESDDDKISKIDPRLSEWIPPDRPLSGDKGYSHLYRKQQELTEEEELQQLEEELKRLEEADLSDAQQPQPLPAADISEGTKDTPKQQQQSRKSQAQPVDWLQTRRERLGTTATIVDGRTVSYERPGQALQVLHHTLLTADEIIDYLVSLGGINPNLIQEQTTVNGDGRWGGTIQGMIFVSCNSSAHVRMLAQSLVDQLKARKLQEVGVQGAHHGPEGSQDLDETWLAIDCYNYIVHIQDEPTRRMLNLEGWWSQPNPLDGSENNEDAVDDFVANNPVPDAYGRSVSNTNNSWNDTLQQLQNKRWTAPHKRVVDNRPRPRRNKGGKKKR